MKPHPGLPNLSASGCDNDRVKLLLIRHGQSSNNVLTAAGHPFAGRSADPELTEKGIVQTEELALAFREGRLPRLTALVSSPMVRAVQTAAPLAEAFDLPILVNTQAYEVGGVYTGIPQTPSASQGASASRLAALSPRVVLPPDVGEDGWYTKGARVEDQPDAQARGDRLYQELCAQHTDSDEVVGLVCHEWIIQYLIRSALGLTNAQADPDPWFIIVNTATTLIETGRPPARPFEGTGLSALWWVNRFDHLTHAEITH